MKTPQTFSIPTEDLVGPWTVPFYQDHGIRSISSDHLTWRSLGDLAVINSGAYASEYADAGIPYLRVDNIRRIILNISPGDLVFIDPTFAEAEFRSQHYTRPRDVVVSRTGTLGKAVLIGQRQAGWLLSQHLTRITPKDSGELRPEWLALYLNTPAGSQRLMNRGFGSTRLELTHDALRQLAVPVISIRAQKDMGRRLARSLNMYYGLIERIERRIEETNAFLTGFLPTCEGLPSEEGPYCHSTRAENLSDIWLPQAMLNHNGAWFEKVFAAFESVSLGECADIARGKGTRVLHYSASGFPFLRTSSLINFSIDPLPDHFAWSELYRSFGQEIADGDVLVTIEGKIGQVAYLTSSCPVVFKNHIERVRVRTNSLFCALNNLDVWIYLILQSDVGKEQFRRATVVQSTIPGIASRLRNFRIPLPRTPNQKRRYEALMSRAREDLVALSGILAEVTGLRNEAIAYAEEE